MSEMALLRYCADYLGVKVAALRSPGRGSQRLADARAQAYWAFRYVARFSYPRIGRLFKRDHTTVIHGVQRINASPGLADTARDMCIAFLCDLLPSEAA